MMRRAAVVLLALIACSGPPGWETLEDPEGDVKPGELAPAIVDLADLTGVDLWATTPDLVVKIRMKGAARSLAARRTIPALEYRLWLASPGDSAQAEPVHEYTVAFRLSSMPKGGDPVASVVASFCDSKWRTCRRAREILTTLENGMLEAEIPRSAIPQLSLPFQYRVAGFVQRDLGFLDQLHEGFGCLISCGFGSLPPGADNAPDFKLLGSAYAQYPA